MKIEKEIKIDLHKKLLLSILFTLYFAGRFTVLSITFISIIAIANLQIEDFLLFVSFVFFFIDSGAASAIFTVEFFKNNLRR